MNQALATPLQPPSPLITFSSPPFLCNPSSMDWYTWLSNSSLEPGLVYQYSLIFSNNELEGDDVAHFNHQFLQSMGISIAKHMLEILKLARNKDKTSPPPPLRPVGGLLLSAVSKSKEWMGKHVCCSAARCDSSAIVVVPMRPSCEGGGASRKSLLKKSRKLVQAKRGRQLMMLADGTLRMARPGAEGIRWDSMFQDLKPT